MIRFFLLLLISTELFAEERLSTEKLEEVYGTNKNEKFSIHRPSYFIFGPDDLKLQFSFKYRLAKSLPLYFAYSQLMFWEVYDESKPFRDINFNPEVFYRLFEGDSESLKTIDMGYLHSSNGKDLTETRSLDRIFLRGNYLTKFKRHFIDFNLMVFKIFNKDDTNINIVNHLGYWDLTVMMSDLIVMDTQSFDLELRTYAGGRGYDIDRGAFQVGVIFNTGSDNLNPSIYFQRFEGYGENLLAYNRKRTEYRLGLMFSF